MSSSRLRNGLRGSEVALSDMAIRLRSGEVEVRKKSRKRQEQGADNAAAQEESYQGKVVESEGLLTTSQAARMAGVSPSTIVRHRSELGAVPGPGGAFLIRTEVLQQKITTLRRHVAVAALGPTSGSVASAVFAALKARRHPSDIVIELQVAPEVVLSLRDQFEQMHGRRPGAPKPQCRCGSGRSPTGCVACTVTLDLIDVERRTVEGGEEVRITGQSNWARRPNAPPVGSLVCTILASKWVSVDSEEGREIVEAIPISRPEWSSGASEDI